MNKPALGSPLEGLKVLDMSRVLAGPFAGRMLCDLGADVVKVEPPEGDSTRLWGRMAGGISSYFNMANAGKRCISIDLRAEGARDLVIELAAKADVVLENFRPDVMPRLGIGYEKLAANNPRLIMLSISGFGRDGPESRRPAYAPIVHAELGLIHRVQNREGVKVDLPLSVADTNAGLHGLVALLSAVIMRDRTGLGQHIDLSMLDATLVSDDQLHFEIEHAEATRNLPPDIWETGVGGILVSVDFRHLWKLLTTDFGITDPSTGDTPLEEKIALRRGAVAAFMKNLGSWDAVERAMDKMNLAWGRVRAGKDLREQPTLASRASIVEIDDRAGGTRPVAQSPYRFSQASAGVRGPAPHRGEHNSDVLAQWLRRSEGEISDLYARGIISQDLAEPG
jgi:crotonobetainyl-CoA:carnitine CoA-transferase CaiB-like acyl-CoA transferase